MVDISANSVANPTRMARKNSYPTRNQALANSRQREQEAQEVIAAQATKIEELEQEIAKRDEIAKQMADGHREA